MSSTTRTKRNRWDTAPSSLDEPKAKQAKLDDDDKISRAKALKEKIAAQLAALKSKSVTSSSRNGNESSKTLQMDENKTKSTGVLKKARVLELNLDDAKPNLDEIRTVKANQTIVEKSDDLISSNVNDSQKGKAVQETKKKEKINPYLIHLEGNVGDADGDAAAASTEEVLLDGRIDKLQKVRRAHRPIHFVPAGVFIQKGERKRAKEEAAAKAGFVSGRKEGTYVKSSGIANILSTDNPKGDASVLHIPLPAEFAKKGDSMPHIVEWWDMELLPSKLKKQISEFEKSILIAKSKSAMLSVGDNNKSLVSDESIDKLEEIRSQCDKSANIAHCKAHKFVQHPIPVKPAYASTEKPKVATLHLTKKELKRQRKLRRAEKQRDLQDQQALGLIPAPEPRLTMANFMQVLGDQAVLDPSKIEAVVAEKIAARRLKHEQMNLERKLTPKERAEKKWQKFAQDDTSRGLSCALFYVKDMSHPYHRAKVDLNAQQMSISGGVVEVNGHLSVVIAEGGARAIKKFVRLMTVRMKWKGIDNEADNESSSDEEMLDNDGNDEQATQKFNSNNSCSLLWQGINPKRLFKGFQFQSCIDSYAARKVLEAKGLANFWDQAEQFSKNDDTNAY